MAQAVPSKNTQSKPPVKKPTEPRGMQKDPAKVNTEGFKKALDRGNNGARNVINGNKDLLFLMASMAGGKGPVVFKTYAQRNRSLEGFNTAYTLVKSDLEAKSPVLTPDRALKVLQDYARADKYFRGMVANDPETDVEKKARELREKVKAQELKNQKRDDDEKIDLTGKSAVQPKDKEPSISADKSVDLFIEYAREASIEESYDLDDNVEE